MSSGQIMVVLIVLIIAVSRIMQSRYGGGLRHRRARRDEHGYTLPARHADAGDSFEADRLRGEVRTLKDRIQVLERIVTDGDRNRGLDLEREIEALRDAREEARK